jgi:hypothetical protein
VDFIDCAKRTDRTGDVFHSSERKVSRESRADVKTSDQSRASSKLI